MMDDKKFMRKALALAGKADPTPNPRVGAVIVKNGKVISTGFHRRAGGPHAEIEALRRAKSKAKGATLYVTLEPCSHYGKTPPCTKAIIEAGISRVVFGAHDPTKKVKGAERLREAGIAVKAAVMAKEALKINPAFEKVATQELPFVTLRSVVSVDGKIACKGGDSKWISGMETRKFGHRLRAMHEAVLVGIGTVMKDDPRLTARLVKGADPIRVVLDSRLRLPLDARGIGDGRLIVATCKRDRNKRKKLEARGVKILEFSGRQVPIKALLRRLAGMDITSVLVEGGGEVNASFVESGLVDRYYFFVCPKIIGGREAKTTVEGQGIVSMKYAKNLFFEKVERVGPDVLITAVPK